MWVIRDTPRKRGDYRNEEWLAFRVPAARADRIARRHTRGGFSVCAFLRAGEPDVGLRADYKRMRYRLITTESLMVHPLRPIARPRPPRGIFVSRVLSARVADRLARMVGVRQILPEHLRPGAPLRQYIASRGRRIIGHVRSNMVGRASWCSNMYVIPKLRRRGIGRALVGRMLADDRKAGSREAVLLASHAGEKLYAAVGYRTIATLYLFTPPRP